MLTLEKILYLSAEELRSETRTELTSREEYFLLNEHLEHMNLVESIDSTAASIMGAVVTYQNMYSS